MLFITVKSANPEQVPKVLQVVEETKRIRHKAGAQDLGVLLYVVSLLFFSRVDRGNGVASVCSVRHH